jgi:3-hydroxybutyryl-CoA dehydrogenase
MKAEEIRRVLIIGGGTMGQQIATQFTLYGCDVVIYDIKEELLEKAMQRIEKIARRIAAYRGISAEQVKVAVNRIATTTIPEEAARGIDLVSESVPEDPELKGRVFGLFNKICPPEAIFTTNASTLLPSMFASATGRPDKFLALHFHDLRTNIVVDIMPHPGTSTETISSVQGFAKRMGLIDILLKNESSGYVFNAMLRAVLESAQTLAANDISSIEDIDRSWMGVMHAPMGPFGIMDSIGIDTAWKVTAYWAKRTGESQLQKNASFLKQFVDRRELGLKTRRGFYAYPNPAFAQPGFVSGQGKETKISL